MDDEYRKVSATGEKMIEMGTWYGPLTEETNFSKYFSMVIFILLPFIGFLVGMEYASKNATEPQIVMTESNSAEESATTETKLEETVTNQDELNSNDLSITNINPELITLSDGKTISIEVFPDMIAVSEDADFGSSDRFNNAVLSPDKEWLAISISGASHDFGWLYKLNDSSIHVVVFSYGGGVDVDTWRNDSEVVYLRTTPKPSTSEVIVNVNQLPEYPL